MISQNLGCGGIVIVAYAKIGMRYEITLAPPSPSDPFGRSQDAGHVSKEKWTELSTCSQKYGLVMGRFGRIWIAKTMNQFFIVNIRCRGEIFNPWFIFDTVKNKEIDYFHVNQESWFTIVGHRPSTKWYNQKQVLRKGGNVFSEKERVSAR